MTNKQKQTCRNIDDKEFGLFTSVMTGGISELTWVQTMESLMDVDPRATTVKSQIKLYKNWRRKHLKFAYEELNKAERANKCLQMLKSSFSNDRGNKHDK